MNLKRNIAASYISQIYVMAAGIVIMPLYLKYMGSEAYGLVGFFSMLQMWFNLLDLGLTPTISRETARFHGGAVDALNFRQLVRALEGIFLGIALIGGGGLFWASGYMVQGWLKIGQLPIAEAKTALQYMAVIIALRWISGLYRGIVSGAELLVWLGGYNVLVATLRFVGVLAPLIYLSPTPTTFFAYQLAVACFELAVLLFKAYWVLPRLPQTLRLPWSWTPLKPVLKFSLSLAFTSSVWVVVTQTDKLILSKILPLAEYGYFTLAVLVANGVTMIGTPIVGAIIPRMVKLEAEGNTQGVIAVYRQSTQLIVVIAGAVATSVAFFAAPLLWAWTGDKALAQQAAPILLLYSIGNGVLAVTAFPSYLQYAKGDVKLHLLGNAIFVVFLVPAIIWAASHYGGIGAGYVWLGMNLLYLFTWVPFSHRQLHKGLHLPWFCRDILVIFVSLAGVAYGCSKLMPPLDNRFWLLAYMAGCGLLVLLAGAGSCSLVQNKLMQRFACKPSSVPLKGHTGEKKAVAASPNIKRKKKKKHRTPNYRAV